MRARRVDALRPRLDAPRSRAPRRGCASPSSRARARCRRAARGARRRRSRSAARRRCRRRRASRSGARARRRPVGRARPSPHASCSVVTTDGPLARPVELAEEDPLPACRARARRSSSGTSTCGPISEARMCDGRVRLALLDVLPAPVVADDLLERRLEVARHGRVGVLVDRHAGGRVRDVDERGGALGAAPSTRVAHLRRDVDELGLPLGRDGDLGTAGILRRRVAAHAALRPRARRLSATHADRFIAELDEEYYLHFAGLKEALDLEPIYERHARADDARDGADRSGWRWTATAARASSGGSRARATSATLTREHEEKQARARGRAEGDRRRRGDPVPDAPPDDRERAADRDKREQLEADAGTR